MENEKLKELMQQRENTKAGLRKATESLKDISPMAVLTGQVNIDGFLAQVESVLHVNDVVITELVSRELNRSEAEHIGLLGG